MKLSVIIPAYNEADRLPQTLLDAHQWLVNYASGAFEIIVVDDGSSDHCCSVVQALQVDMPELILLEQAHNMGKGAAVRHGMLAASGDIQLFMDADHSTHISEIEHIYPLLQQHCDIVIASRQHPDSIIDQHQSLLREHMGKSFNWLMRNITRLDLSDTQCGFKVFTAKASRHIFKHQQLNGFSFDVEVLFLAKQLGYRVSEAPVQWTNSPCSKVQILLDPIKMFADILKVRLIHRSLPVDTANSPSATTSAPPATASTRNAYINSILSFKHSRSRS